MTNYPLRLPDHVMAEARALYAEGLTMDKIADFSRIEG